MSYKVVLEHTIFGPKDEQETVLTTEIRLFDIPRIGQTIIIETDPKETSSIIVEDAEETEDGFIIYSIDASIALEGELFNYGSITLKGMYAELILDFIDAGWKVKERKSL
jgi:hypothetical protein